MTSRWPLAGQPGAPGPDLPCLISTPAVLGRTLSSMHPSAAVTLLTEAHSRASKLVRHAELKPEALETLLTALRAQPPDNEARIAALVPFCIDEDDGGVVVEAFGQSQALPALLQLLAPEHTAEVQLAAMTAIFFLHKRDPIGYVSDALYDSGLIRALVSLLGSAEDCVRARAAYQLSWAAGAHLQVEEIAAAGVTMAPLIPLLRSADEMAQCDAAHAIGLFAAMEPLRNGRALHEAIPLLVPLLGSANARVQHGAALAIHTVAVEIRHTRPKALLVAGFCERVVQLLLATWESSGQETRPGTLYYAGAVLQTILHSDYHRAAVARTPGLVDALMRIPPAPENKKSARFARFPAQDVLETLLLHANDDVRRRVLASARTSHAELADSEAELRSAHSRLDAKLCSLADAVGEPTRQHDVVLQCADGTELGASRLLLARHSEYYEAQLGGGLAEGGQREVRADPAFSSAAHEALLRQLHSVGEAPLPAEPSLLLELLRLTNKLQPPTPPAAASSADVPAASEANVLAGVARRCEDALLAALDVDNCLDMLRHAKAAGGPCARLVEGVRALAKEQIKAVVQQERWAAFKRDDPAEALELMEALAVDFADERASKRPCVTPMDGF